MPQVVEKLKADSTRWSRWKRGRFAQGRCAMRLRYAPGPRLTSVSHRLSASVLEIIREFEDSDRTTPAASATFLPRAAITSADSETACALSGYTARSEANTFAGAALEAQRSALLGILLCRVARAPSMGLTVHNIPLIRFWFVITTRLRFAVPLWHVVETFVGSVTASTRPSRCCPWFLRD
jgi:hypothetical protein